jgi:plasmid segregation protein ParM
MRTIVFPSVIESHNHELRNVAADLLHGMKIFDEGTGYVVGDLALSEGIAPHKAINSSPHDLDYRLLMKAGLLLASTVVDEPIVLTTGFPFSTFQINRKHVAEIVGSTQKITYDTAPYGGRQKQTKTVVVNKIDVLPEVVGCIIGARNGERQQRGAFFMGSVGYGTFEACLSTEGGIVQRTMVSVTGIRYAVELAMRELMQTHYLGMQTEHQFDAAFQHGSSTLNRRKIDLRDVRRRALERYYEDVVSPVLRNAWTDNDFSRTNLLLLSGGGALYPDLVNAFKKEFDGVLEVEVVENPITLASTGYSLRSLNLAGGNKGTAVGLDIGNAQTSLAIASDSTNGWQ